MARYALDTTGNVRFRFFTLIPDTAPEFFLGAFDLELCFGLRSNCLDVNMSTCTPKKSAGKWFLDCDFSACLQSGCDHPFVVQPDHWDNLWLKNNAGYEVEFEKVSLDYRASSPQGSSDVWLITLDTFSPYPGETIGAGGVYSLADNIRESREKALMDVIYSAWSPGSPPWEYDEFADMPYMVQQAAYDIGQVGLVKYAGPNYDKEQHGCDDFYGWFVFNKGNAFDYVMTFHHNCPGGYNFGIGPCDEKDVCINRVVGAYPSEWVIDHAENLGHWPKKGYLQHDRLYRLRFDISGGNRVAVHETVFGSAVFEKVNSNPLLWDFPLYAIPLESPAVFETAEPGDMLVRVDNCGSQNHVMMALAPVGIEIVTVSGEDRLKLPILESRLSQVKPRHAAIVGDVQEKCGGVFKFDYYLGKANIP